MTQLGLAASLPRVVSARNYLNSPKASVMLPVMIPPDNVISERSLERLGTSHECVKFSRASTELDHRFATFRNLQTSSDSLNRSDGTAIHLRKVKIYEASGRFLDLFDLGLTQS